MVTEKLVIRNFRRETRFLGGIVDSLDRSFLHIHAVKMFLDLICSFFFLQEKVSFFLRDLHAQK